ncbi:MAG: helix-turn-helix domain-containing protein [Nanoarchaeota archaeon]
MIVQKDFINRIKQFGLNSYEAKIWTALLSRGISTAGELSDISNVPRSRSYDVLESLEKKGFIIMKLGKPIKYIAVEPAEVLERVKKRIQVDAEQISLGMDKLKDSEVLKELTLLHNQGIDLVEPTDLSGSVKGRTNIMNQLESMVKTAEKSIVLMTTEEGLVRKAKHLKSHLAKAKARGVKIRIAVPITKKSEDAAKQLSEIAEIKHIDAVKARMMIVDDKQFTFMINDESADPSFDAGIWVNTPFFTSALKGMFETVWKQEKAIVFK